jgi:hypothetical protein
MNEVKLILSREYRKDETLGKYMIMQETKTLFTCCCLELPWLNNQHNVSCIPEGIYDVIKVNWPPKHPDSFLIQNVSDRDGVMIHIGNYAEGSKIDTEGCQLPGMNFIDLNGDGAPDVEQSTIAMAALNHLLPDNFKLIII